MPTELLSLYNPPDVDDESTREWCHCGPASLAAALRLPCEYVRGFFKGIESRLYVNPTQMQAALSLSNVMWRRAPSELPQYGLAFIQIVGPWDAAGVPVAAAYKHTHWIASAFYPLLSKEAAPNVWDINAGMWTSRAEWERDVMPPILASHKKATGWRTRWACELTLA